MHPHAHQTMLFRNDRSDISLYDSLPSVYPSCSASQMLKDHAMQLPKCLRNSETTSNQPQNSASRNSKRTPPRSAHRIPGRSRARRNGSKHRRAITHRRAPRHRDRRQTTRRAEPLTIKASARGLKPRRTSNRGEEPLIVPCCDRVNHSGRGRRWRRQRLRGRGDRGSGVSSLSRKEC